MELNLEQLREHFEKRFPHLILIRQPSGRYVNTATTAAWTGYLAGAERLAVAYLEGKKDGLEISMGKDDLTGTDDEARAIARRVMGDTKFKKGYMAPPGALPHRWVVEAVEAGIAHGKSKADHMNHLVQDMQEEQHSMLNTSVIRANMVALAEAVMNGKCECYGPDNETASKIKITINLEAQRTIWDRVELSTDRSHDGTEVIFTVERK